MSTLGIVDCQSVIQKQQNYGAGERSMMISRVFFTLTIQPSTVHHLFVELTQPYGTDYEDEPVEVSRPYVREQGSTPNEPLNGPRVFREYKGIYNHNAMSEGFESYHRSQVGSSASGIRIEGGGNITMGDNTFISPFRFPVPLGESSEGGPW